MRLVDRTTAEIDRLWDAGEDVVTIGKMLEYDPFLVADYLFRRISPYKDSAANARWWWTAFAARYAEDPDGMMPEIEKLARREARTHVNRYERRVLRSKGLTRLFGPSRENERLRAVYGDEGRTDIEPRPIEEDLDKPMGLVPADRPKRKKRKREKVGGPINLFERPEPEDYSDAKPLWHAEESAPWHAEESEPALPLDDRNPPVRKPKRKPKKEEKPKPDPNRIPNRTRVALPGLIVPVDADWEPVRAAGRVTRVFYVEGVKVGTMNAAARACGVTAPAILSAVRYGTHRVNGLRVEWEVLD